MAKQNTAGNQTPAPEPVAPATPGSQLDFSQFMGDPQADESTQQQPAPTAPALTQPDPPVDDVPAPEVQSDPTGQELPVDDGTQSDQPPSLISTLESLGFEGVEDEASAISRLGEYFQQNRAQQEELARQLREQQEMLAYFRGRELANQNQNQPPQQQQPVDPQHSTDTPWWNPPPIDQHLIARYRTQEGGWAENTPPDVRVAGENFERYIENWSQRLIYQPDQIFSDLEERIIQRLTPQFHQEFEARTAQQAQDQELESIRTENPWMFARDPRTNQPTESWSQAGAATFAEAKRLYESGLSQLEAWRVAIRLNSTATTSPQMGLNNPAPAPAATPQAETPEQIAARRRQEHIAKGRQMPNRTGALAPASSTDPAPNPDDKRSAGERLLESMINNGAFAAV